VTNLISVEQLSSPLTQYKVVDASWYLPNQDRSPQQEYLKSHIPGARFFDIDLVCDQQSDLPHMLPSSEMFAEHIGAMGISNDDSVVVYDTAGLFSAARLWWMLRIFGHNKVQLLDGGFPAWLSLGKRAETGLVSIKPVEFQARLDSSRVVEKQLLMENCQHGQVKVLDARPLARFNGTAPEPRAGLASGHMPYSISLPFGELLENGQLKSAIKLREIFTSLDLNASDHLVSSCGSGVTAAVIVLALEEAGLGFHRLYDGAWAEWASCRDCPVLTSSEHC